MTTANPNFRILNRIKDSAFNVDSLENYELYIQAGPNDLQVSVFDVIQRKILLLEDFIFPSAKGPGERMRIIHQIFDDHHLLLANFWKGVKVSIKNNKYTFIPESLYHHKISRPCLELNTSYDEDNEEIFDYYSRNHKLWTVFSADKAFIDLISEVYPRVSYKIVHQSSVLAEGFQAINGSSENMGMFIFIDRFVLHIAIQRQNELYFFNSFQIKQFDDYQRYISMAASQYHLNPVNSQVKVWGFMSDQTNNFRELRKKIPGLEPGLRPIKIKLSHAFDEIPENFYFDIFSMPYLTD